MRIFTDGHTNLPHLTVENIDHLKILDNIVSSVLGHEALESSKQQEGLTLETEEYEKVYNHIILYGFEIITVKHVIEFGGISWFEKLNEEGYSPISRQEYDDF